jgi:hypothetical protein
MWRLKPWAAAGRMPLVVNSLHCWPTKIACTARGWALLTRRTCLSLTWSVAMHQPTSLLHEATVSSASRLPVLTPAQAASAAATAVVAAPRCAALCRQMQPAASTPRLALEHLADNWWLACRAHEASSEGHTADGLGLLYVGTH